VKLISSFFCYRETTLQFDNYTLKLFHIEMGISQRSLLSLILYLFYNVNLLEIYNDTELGTSVLKYIDNINVINHETTAEENYIRLSIVYVSYQK
jgi:hypothetical protein